MRSACLAKLVPPFSLCISLLAGCGTPEKAPVYATPVVQGAGVVQGTPVRQGVTGVAEPPAAETLEWPRQFEEGGLKISIYQPQIEKWQGEDFQTRSAVSVTPAGTDKPLFGVVWMKARAEVDKAAGLVTLNDVQVTRANFPSATDEENDYLALIRKHLPTATKTVALAELESSFAISEAVKNAKTVPVKNDPPRIIYTTTPGLLVLVDGAPVLRPMPGLDVERVINTHALIVKARDRFYINAWDRWYEANTIEGPWSVSAQPPPILEQAKQAAVAGNNVELMPAKAEAPEITPTLYVSTVPAELIQTRGAPEFVPIEGTEIMQVKNSDNAVFLNMSDQQYFVLLSGRWFRGPSLKGPWTYVPYQNLPGDFAKIPADHPKANVLVSVAGTPQANEAVIANSIPQTATVKRTEPKLEVGYDGAPQFQPIEGTPLFYAVNSPTPVIQVDSKTYYSIQNGIWFVDTSPNGPWVVATTVPAVIYTIPPSSPLHYVTYARVYGSTPEVVYVGYTPGYLGTVVCPDYVVVYGSGWYYRPYIGSYWVGWPCTYGYGASFAYSWGVGFGVGFAAGSWWGGCYDPWWGPFGWGWRHGIHYTHVSINHVSIYDHWRAPGPGLHLRQPLTATTLHGRTAAQPWAHHFNPYSSRPSEGLHFIPANRTMQTAATRPYTSGSRLGAAPGSQPNAAPNNRVAQPNPAKPGAVYSGNDGRVYRVAPSGKLERNSGSSWQTVPPNQRQGVERDVIGRGQGGLQYTPAPRSASPGQQGSGGSGYRGGGNSGGSGHRGSRKD